MSVKKLKLLLFMFAGVICLAAVLGFGHREGELQELAPVETTNINSQVLTLAKNTSFVNEFVAENPDYQYEITVLQPENITQLSKKYPVIYGNLPNKTLYRIDYKNGRGMLLIVDLENGEVLKHFRTAGVSVG